MKSFIFGAAGFLVAALTFLVVSAMYSDYSAEAQMDSWCRSLSKKIIEIEDYASKHGHLQLVSDQVEPFQFSENDHVHTHEILSNGTIIVNGGHLDQLMVIVPSLEKSKLTWKTLQSPSKLTTHNCQF